MDNKDKLLSEEEYALLKKWKEMLVEVQKGRMSLEDVLERVPEFGPHKGRLTPIIAESIGYSIVEHLFAKFKFVCYLGSARLSRSTKAYKQVQTTARLLALRGFSSVSGGGGSLMEAPAVSVREIRARTDQELLALGFNIQLPWEEVPNEFLDLSFVLSYFILRQDLLLKASRFGVVVGRGGFGTLFELFHCLTLIQTGKLSLQRPICVLRCGLWSWALRVLITACMGTIGAESLELFCFASPEAAAKMICYVADHAPDDGEERSRVIRQAYREYGTPSYFPTIRKVVDRWRSLKAYFSLLK